MATRSLCSIPPSYAPSLVFCHGEKHRDQTFCTLFDGCYHVRSVPEMRRMRCLVSCFGWLILPSHSFTQCYLFNPTSLEIIHLPPLLDKFDVGVLTYPPSDPNCVIVVLSKKRKLFNFCRVGGDNNKWIEQKLKRKQENGILLKGSDFEVECCQGKVYLFSLEWINIIDFHRDFASVMLHEQIEDLQSPIPEARWYTKLYVESCGEIFHVCEIHLGYSDDVTRTLDVCKLNLSDMVWEKVESLGDRIFLLNAKSSATSSASLSASELGMKGNCIYFFHHRKTSLYRFDMDDGTIAVTLPCPNKFNHWDEPFWIVPTSKLQMKREVVNVEKAKYKIYDEITNMKELPIELFECIISGIFVDDWFRFRLSSKALMSITQPIREYSLLSESICKTQPIPWLMSFSDRNNRGVCTLYHPIYNDAYAMNIPELADAIIRHAKFGWLLMSKRNVIFFFHPITRETIKLPTYRKSYDFVNISFSSPPSSSDYIVLGHTSASPFVTEIAVYKKELGEWFDFEFMEGNFFASHSSPIFHNGVFYCLSKDGKLGIFYPDEDLELVWKVLPVPAAISCGKSSLFMTSIRSFILEYGGEIFSVFLGLMGKPVWVFQFDQSKMQWIRVESLGDKVAFLSHTSSVLVPAGLKGVENRLYLPNFQGQANVFYSLRTSKYHCFGSKESREDWINTCERWNCSWFDTIL